MYDGNNIFAKIIAGVISCKKVYEDDNILAFHDVAPAAPVHVLIIPKQKYISFDDFINKASPEMVYNFFTITRQIAHELGLAPKGYRIITNHGADAHQTVAHFHIHILGGTLLGPLLTIDNTKS